MRSLRLRHGAAHSIQPSHSASNPSTSCVSTALTPVAPPRCHRSHGPTHSLKGVKIELPQDARPQVPRQLGGEGAVVARRAEVHDGDSVEVGRGEYRRRRVAPPRRAKHETSDAVVFARVERSGRDEWREADGHQPLERASRSRAEEGTFRRGGRRRIVRQSRRPHQRLLTQRTDGDATRLELPRRWGAEGRARPRVIREKGRRSSAQHQPGAPEIHCVVGRGAHVAVAHQREHVRPFGKGGPRTDEDSVEAHRTGRVDRVHRCRVERDAPQTALTCEPARELDEGLAQLDAVVDGVWADQLRHDRREVCRRRGGACLAGVSGAPQTHRRRVGAARAYIPSPSQC